MGLFLFRFWPVVIPLLVYAVWMEKVARKARKAGLPRPKFREGPWYWLVISTLAVAFLCFLWLYAHIQDTKGTYVPPHMDKGVMVPGTVEETK